MFAKAVGYLDLIFCNKPYVKHQLKQPDEINTEEYEDIGEVALPADAVSDFVAIRWDNEWFPFKSKNLYVHHFHNMYLCRVQISRSQFAICEAFWQFVNEFLHFFKKKSESLKSDTS